MRCRHWPFALLLSLAAGCTVPNPTYQRRPVVDGGPTAGAGGTDASTSGGAGQGGVGTRGDDARDAGDLPPDQGDVGGDLSYGGAADRDAVAADAVSDVGPPSAPDVPAGPPDLAVDRPIDRGVDSVAGPLDGPLPVGTGLLAQYFDGIALENGDTGDLTLQRIDATIDFDWGAGRVIEDLDDDWFSVRWTGQVMPLHSETYTFRTLTDEGVRLWVNGTLIIDNWVTQQSVSRTGTITLQAFRRVDIKMEYFEQTGTAVARLYWSSPSQPSQIIPRSCLFAP